MLNGKINVTTHSLYAGHHCAHSAIVYERDLIPIDNKKKTYMSISPLCALILTSVLTKCPIIIIS